MCPFACPKTESRSSKHPTLYDYKDLHGTDEHVKDRGGREGEHVEDRGGQQPDCCSLLYNIYIVRPPAAPLTWMTSWPLQRRFSFPRFQEAPPPAHSPSHGHWRRQTPITRIRGASSPLRARGRKRPALPLLPIGPGRCQSGVPSRRTPSASSGSLVCRIAVILAARIGSNRGEKKRPSPW